MQTLRAVLGAALVVLMQGNSADAETNATTFASRAQQAMDTMMIAMASTKPGDVDRQFVAMMVPHHQGAIDMALAELRFGRVPRLQRIAQGIVIEQQAEIAAMRLALKRQGGAR